MSAPHADRDHSEQPRVTDQLWESARRAAEPWPTLAPDAGASRSVSARVVGASEAQAEIERLRGWIDRSERMQRRAEAAEAERERLAEVVARVERVRQRLLDPVQHVTEGPLISRIKAESWLRAALSGPTPAETPQNGPEPALSREQGTSGQSGEGEALRGAEKRCGACAAGWFGSRWHNPPFSCHYHCECATPCRACAVGDGFHRSSPHKPAEHDACGCQEVDR